MRIDFISRLALLLVAGFLIVATQVWGGGTIEWLFIVGGIVMIALAAGALGMAPGPQRTLDALLGVLGVWAIVQAIVFDRLDAGVGVVHDRGGRGAARHSRPHDPRAHDRTRRARAQRRHAGAGRRASRAVAARGT